MKERYRSMMEQVKLSETGRAAIEEKLAQGEKRRMGAFPRAAVAAACLCLALVGGVAAGRLGSVRMSGEQSSGEHSGYDVSVDIAEDEQKELSQELRSDLENGALRRSFASREELTEYLGFELIRSETLENAPINEHLARDFEYGWDLRPELALDPGARYILSATAYDGTEMEGFPKVLKISMHRVVENYTVYIDARVITGSFDGQLDLAGEEFKPEPLIDHELLVDENGCLILDEKGNAIIETTEYESAEKRFYSENYVMANGIEATIVTIETIDPRLERAKESGIPAYGSGFCEYVAYFVHEGVVYSVRPWAVYDNTIEGNYINGTSLTILYHILDSFE